ncbi:hypothetical protein D0Y65_011671 [Glycine soja]|uniref:Uncharacterized protein n=1 Tax=Glycine soja TaxID=3848 RepID=A0A445KL83_GLYSO|nr:hypothetical protein D0Y65_011671 [Glycine soja]
MGLSSWLNSNSGIAAQKWGFVGHEKLLLIGDSSVGKSCLLLRFAFFMEQFILTAMASSQFRRLSGSSNYWRFSVTSIQASGRKRHGFWVKMFLLGSLLACILFFSLTSGSRCVLCFTRLPLIHSLLLQFDHQPLGAKKGQSLRVALLSLLKYRLHSSTSLRHASESSSGKRTLPRLSTYLILGKMILLLLLTEWARKILMQSSQTLWIILKTNSK